MKTHIKQRTSSFDVLLRKMRNKTYEKNKKQENIHTLNVDIFYGYTYTHKK